MSIGWKYYHTCHGICTTKTPIVKIREAAVFCVAYNYSRKKPKALDTNWIKNSGISTRTWTIVFTFWKSDWFYGKANTKTIDDNENAKNWRFFKGNYWEAECWKQNTKILTLTLKSESSFLNQIVPSLLYFVIRDDGSNEWKVTGKFPNSFLCFAYSFHEDPSGFWGNICPLYHVLIENQYLEEGLQRSVLSSYDVPRLFTCLKALHYYLLAKHIQR